VTIVSTDIASSTGSSTIWPEWLKYLKNEFSTRGSVFCQLPIFMWRLLLPTLQVQQVVQPFGPNGWNTCKTSLAHVTQFSVNTCQTRFIEQHHFVKTQRYRLGASWQPTYISTSITYPNRISLPRLRAFQYSIPALSLPTDYRKSTLLWQLSCHFQAIDPRSTTTNQYTHPLDTDNKRSGLSDLKRVWLSGVPGSW
jgi:hypothetical protein